MSKFLIFNCAKIEQNGTSVPLEAKVAIEVSSIDCFHQTCNYDDLPINGVIVIRTKNAQTYHVIKTFDEMVEEVKESFV